MTQNNQRQSRSFILIFFGALAFVIAALVLFFSVRDYRNITEKPEVPLSELKNYAGTNKAVRIRAAALADPALSTPGGEIHALESIEVYHTEHDSQNRRDVTDFTMIEPSAFCVGDGKFKIYADTEKSITTGMIHDRGAEELTDKGPGSRLAPLLCPAIVNAIGKYCDSHHDIKLTTIEKGAPLVVVGKIEQKGDSLWIEPDDNILWVTTRSPEEALKNASSTMGWSALGILLGLAMTGYGIILLRKRA